MVCTGSILSISPWPNDIAHAGQDAKYSLLFKGQLSTWVGAAQLDEAWNYWYGLRYLPEFSVVRSLGAASRIGFELAVNALLADGTGEAGDPAQIDPYRTTVWHATDRTELVAGLQKIAFGPAHLLRPLQWFDRIDPADPLSLTEGVWGLRMRYFSVHMANAWLWCLYPQNKTKGYERLPTANQVPEWGGRFQIPALDGDLGVSVNQRRVDASEFMISDYDEQRLGQDGRWDLGVGFWFEAVFQRQEHAFLLKEWQKMGMIGADYTLGWGNGLYLLVEQMAVGTSEAAWGWDEERWFGAILLSFPLNILDTLQFIAVYDWKAQRAATHLSWQRTYDHFSLNLSLFDYPRGDVVLNGIAMGSAIAGPGAMLMLVFNH